MKLTQVVLKNKKSFGVLLLAGAVYLLLISAAHFFQIKVPVLFVYFDVPSTVYQDRIIAAVSFAIAIFLFGCFKERERLGGMARYAVIAAWGLVIILAANNALTDPALRSNFVYWLQIAAIAVYVAWLTWASRNRGSDMSDESGVRREARDSI